jgi:peroxiredoxin
MSFLLFVAAMGWAGQVAPPESVYDQKGRRAGYRATPDSIQKAKAMEGRPAPSFTTSDTLGKPVDSKALFAKPTLLVFIEAGCPCCDSGKVYFDRLNSLHGKAANVLGLVYGSKAKSLAWGKANRPKFRIAPDPEGRIAKAYEARFGLSVRLIDPKGKIALAAPGYSADLLRTVSKQMAALSKKRVPPFEAHPAPGAMASGCPLGSMRKGG